MTNQSELQELHRQYTDSQSKYVYFLLAASGAAMGYALQKLEGLALSWNVALALVAIGCWLVSFLAGCKRITWTQSTMYANYSLLQLQYGLHPEQPPSPQHTQAAVAGVRTAIERNSNTASFYYTLQFWSLGAGVAVFIAWRIFQMAQISTYAR